MIDDRQDQNNSLVNRFIFISRKFISEIKKANSFTTFYIFIISLLSLLFFSLILDSHGGSFADAVGLVSVFVAISVVNIVLSLVLAIILGLSKKNNDLTISNIKILILVNSILLGLLSAGLEFSFVWPAYIPAIVIFFLLYIYKIRVDKKINILDNNRKENTVVLLVIIFVVFAFMYGFGKVVYHRDSIASSMLTLFHMQTNSDKDFDNWNVYTNIRFGFEIKYPDNFYIYDSVDDEKEELIPPSTNSSVIKITENKNKVFCCEPSVFSLEVYEDLGIGIEELVNNITDPVKDLVIRRSTDFSMGDRTYRAYLESRIDSPGNIVAFTKSNKTFLIKYDNKDAFEKILTTFKLIDTDTNNWKTYRNEEFGFEFRYPKGYTYIRDSNVNFDDIETLTLNFSYEERHEFTIYINPPGIGLFEGCDSVKPSVIDLNNIEFEKTVYCNENVVYVANINGNRYLFMDSALDNNIFDKIISTFKFVDTDDLSDWQTYLNEELGLKFQYPPDWGYRHGDEYYKYDVAFAREKSFRLLDEPTDWRPPVTIKTFDSIKELDPDVSSLQEYAEKYLLWISDELSYIDTVSGHRWMCGEVDGIGYNLKCLILLDDGSIISALSIPDYDIGDRILSSLELI